jgi:Ca2+-binding RTX toxin-like protein
MNTCRHGPNSLRRNAKSTLTALSAVLMAAAMMLVPGTASAAASSTGSSGASMLVQPAGAVAATQPASVTVVGDFQSELGCTGDFQPSCAVTQLVYDANDDVWQGTFTVPAGEWHYKVALNGSFDENYGANATPNGPNITLVLPTDTAVKFYYDNKTHWITDNPTSVIATAPGDYQSEIGCSGDFDPSCLRSWLEDPDGDGIYQFSTDAIPSGTYQTKVAINESFAENYGAGGVPNGPDISFTVPANATVTFTYDPVSHILSITSTIDTTTSITSDASDPSVVGQSVTVQYSVAPVSGSGTPTGNVTVSDGTVSCTGTVAAGQCSLTFTGAGAKSLTASYNGDSNFNPSTSAPEPHQVNPADTTTTITSDSPDPSLVGQSVTVQYSVAATSPGDGIPTGNVTVSDGTISCTGTVAAGQCSLTFTSAGDKSLTASYNGDSNFNPSTSAPETHTVNSPNTPPTAAVTNGQCSTTNMASGLINLTLFDADGDPLTLTLASNSNPVLVPNANIVLGGTGANRTVSVTAAPRKRGQATLTLNLSDGKVTVPVVITVAVGSDKSETLNGTSGTDIMFGLSGQNTINGYAGNDLLCGGNSNDTINGGDGNDIIDGENGDDTISGGDGNDILRGSSGNDTLTGGAGADFFSGGSGVDTATDLNPAQGDVQDGTIP